MKLTKPLFILVILNIFLIAAILILTLLLIIPRNSVQNILFGKKTTALPAKNIQTGQSANKELPNGSSGDFKTILSQTNGKIMLSWDKNLRGVYLSLLDENLANTASPSPAAIIFSLSNRDPKFPPPSITPPKDGAKLQIPVQDAGTVFLPNPYILFEIPQNLFVLKNGEIKNLKNGNTYVVSLQALDSNNYLLSSFYKFIYKSQKL